MWIPVPVGTSRAGPGVVTGSGVAAGRHARGGGGTVNGVAVSAGFGV